MATTYGIIANCNFENRDDAAGKAIHAARKAVESRLTTDAELVAALDSLEETLAEHAESGDVNSVEACREAEAAVVAAYTLEVRAEIESTREARYAS